MSWTLSAASTIRMKTSSKVVILNPHSRIPSCTHDFSIISNTTLIDVVARGFCKCWKNYTSWGPLNLKVQEMNCSENHCVSVYGMICTYIFKYMSLTCMGNSPRHRNTNRAGKNACRVASGHGRGFVTQLHRICLLRNTLKHLLLSPKWFWKNKAP